MNPAARTRQLNQWIQRRSEQDMTYPALHGFLCARLAGPTAPDWQAPLVGLLSDDPAWDNELDSKSSEALRLLITELEQQADAAQLTLPSQCSLPADNPEQVFEQQHPLGQWCYGFSMGFASWPKPRDLNDQATQYRFSLAAELCLFRDHTMARMLHQVAGSDLTFPAYCKRQRQSMKAVLNHLLTLDPNQGAAPATQAPVDNEQTRQWQQWFEQAYACGDQQGRLGWFDRIIADAAPLFDDAFWQTCAGHGWSAHQARPLLAAKAGRADCLLRLGLLEQARDEWQALLTLTVTDEPGCRYPLSTLYALQGDWPALTGLLMRFDEASSWLLYNKALMVFASEGPLAAQPHLTTAIKANAHIPAYLLGARKLPRQEPRHWQEGSRDEAASYALQSRPAWLRHNALIWLRQSSHGREK